MWAEPKIRQHAASAPKYFAQLSTARGNLITWQILKYQFDSKIVEIGGSETTVIVSISKEDLITEFIRNCNFSYSPGVQRFNGIDGNEP